MIIGCLIWNISDRVGASEVTVHRDILFASPGGHDLMLDIHLPADKQTPRLVMHIHGGGWVGGDRKRNRALWLAEYGYAVASIEYRMSHEGIFPTQIHDCKGALRWLRARADHYGYDASKVVVTGTSAGGHLAALMGSSGGVDELEGDTGGHHNQSSSVQGVMNYYGPSDFALRSQFQYPKTDDPNGSVFKLLGGGVKENREAARMASPVTWLTPDDPPFLVLHGDSDNVVFPRQSRHLVAECQKAGIPVHYHLRIGAGHGWNRDEAETYAVLNFLKMLFD